MTYHLHTETAPAFTEDPRAQWRRRLQQKRCLVCGARGLVNNNQSYFCAAHIATHRYCSTCETLRTIEAHGKDSRCKACANERAIAAYYADPDRALYRIRLKQLAMRERNRCDEIFERMRWRIALAAFVRATPGWTWQQRADVLGIQRNHLADTYRRQCRGLCRDADAAERERRR